eukprot:167732-Prymnesium_polylepis.1
MQNLECVEHNRAKKVLQPDHKLVDGALERARHVLDGPVERTGGPAKGETVAQDGGDERHLKHIEHFTQAAHDARHLEPVHRERECANPVDCLDDGVDARRVEQGIHRVVACVLVETEDVPSERLRDAHEG